MSVVNLVSGGVDSTLMALLTQEEGVPQQPLFIDYGQRAAKREWEACRRVFKELDLPRPVRMSLRGFGTHVASGLTDPEMDVQKDAFLPGRNLLFLLVGASFAARHEATSVAIGLLSEEAALFPDQEQGFLKKAQPLLRTATINPRLRIVSPLSHLSKPEVLALAKQKGISGTYSCHSGTEHPCGRCISCLEVQQFRKKGGRKGGR